MLSAYIDAAFHGIANSPDYESGGREFESSPARHLLSDI